MRTLFAIFLLAMVMTIPARGQEVSDAVSPEIQCHALFVTISPEQNSLVVADMVTLTGPAEDIFSFTLNRNLQITRLWCGSGNDVQFELVPYEGAGTGETSETETVQTVRAHLPKGANQFSISYEGVINEPIDPGTALGRVRGDFTSGIISPEGVYLSGESGWYPDTEHSMATFTVCVTVPEPWKTVTQGDLVSRSVAEGRETSLWSGSIPSDGCVLVANEYFVTTREIGGVVCSTYFYQDDPALANSFLDKLEQYIPKYVDLLGPYPYSRFDIVENFFSTGYGMPGFTLMGSRVLRMPAATTEGSLAHEFVHGWWGNFVYFDANKGNWCEGLTSFSTNYYWNILDGRPDDARHFRFRSMVRYSVDVGPEEDYPLRQFRTKMTEVDGDIGYDKSSAVFIMLQEIMGKEKFFEALRLAVERYGGEVATWDDFRTVFEEVSGHDFSTFLSSWLDNAGAMRLGIEEISQTETEEGYKLRFSAVQEGNLFGCFVPIQVTFENAESVLTSFPLFAQDQLCEFEFPSRVLSFQIDPDYYVFRRLTREEIPPCLKVTLSGDPLLIIVPSGGESDMVQVMSPMGPQPGPREIGVKDLYKEVADSVVSSGLNAVIKYDDQVTDDEFRSSSILCLGSPVYNSVAARLAGESEQLGIGDGSFSVNGTEYAGEGMSALVTIRNPFNADRDVTFHFGNSPQAVFKASYMFFYSWDSYVVYDAGNMLGRGEWDMGKGPLHYEL